MVDLVWCRPIIYKRAKWCALNNCALVCAIVFEAIVIHVFALAPERVWDTKLLILLMMELSCLAEAVNSDDHVNDDQVVLANVKNMLSMVIFGSLTFVCLHFILIIINLLYFAS